jgi:outer membrane protein assembly factor BamB
MRQMALAILSTSCLLITSPLDAADWTRFRGPGGMGISTATDVPVSWSSTENITWRTPLPGPGASTPITLGKRIYVTSYSGYGLEAGQGQQDALKRHLLCVNRKSGEIIWQKTFEPKLPEHNYQGEGAYHGYAASTPVTDGKHLFVFFGRSGVFCFDLDGNQLWQASVGEGISGWGSGCSPLLLGNMLIVNASIESGSIVALDKTSGKELWRSGGIGSSWNTPLVVKAGEASELVVSVQNNLLGISPSDGTQLWKADGIHRYVCPSVVAHDGIVYAIGGGHTSLAVRAGGRGDVTDSHTLWRQTKGSNVSSPIYHQGHLYWFSDGGGFLCCQKADSGETVFQERLEPRPGRIWSSPVLADGKLYVVSQHNGTFVVAASPEFKFLSHNVFEDDNSRTNASPAVDDGELLMRTDRFLYSIGK